MLRLPPTRIILDARDIEYHAQNSEKRTQGVQADKGKNRRPFVPKLKDTKSKTLKDLSKLLDSTKGSRSELEQVLRDSVFPKRRHEQWDGSLEEMTNTEAIKGNGRAERTPIDDLGSSTGDGQIDERPRSSSPDSLPRPFSPDETVVDHASVYSEQALSLARDIQEITTLMNTLSTEIRRISSSSARSMTRPRSSTTPRQVSTFLADEDRLSGPTLTGSTVSRPRQIMSSAYDGSYSTAESIHASPAEPELPTTPVRQATNSSGIDRQTDQQRFAAIADSIEYTRYANGAERSDPSLPSPRGRAQATTLVSRLAASPHTSSYVHNRAPTPIAGSTPVQHGTWMPTRLQPQFHSSPPVIPIWPHSNIPVYNDNLPANVQPQTPVGLPRHGIPYMGSWTAPPAHPSLVRQPPTTPTRVAHRQIRLSPGSHWYSPATQLQFPHDQENATMYAEWRRRSRTSAEDQVRLRRGGDILDRTPPPPNHGPGLS